ncbi:rhodanese-like domain-containing protein [Nocardioides rubriscoriae]|uniref:rhodanese-like domain-containing protein n=1 Tax=Nocardioides rubriscoriae TaxID=642762 RepID=UPI0011E00BEA|nr:rhodanese-like domain-containing protein [Nocardioides rubriscoriae]
MAVLTIEVGSLGNRCHLVHDGRMAVVVDPPRDVALVEDAAAAAGLEIAAVAETHVHDDQVSGGLALARRHGADLLLSAGETVAFERVGVRDGDLLTYGGVELQVLDTPGHTRHHQAFLARVTTDPQPAVLLSGGSLLLGTVGRTDLVDPRLASLLAGAQWHSARRLARLDPATLLLPTHGFGSLCASTAVVPPGPADPPATIGDQQTTHPALLIDKETFVHDLVTGLGPIPRHYARMDPLNRAGTGAATPRPARPVTAEEVTDAVLAGSWVVDLRGRAAYAEGHLPGSINVEYSAQFATYVGWLVPWDDDIVLLTDSPQLLEPALRDLARIGIDGVGAHVLPSEQPLTARYRRADWAAYREARALAAATGLRPPVVVDVRQRDEWLDGHLPGALHLPVHEVETGARRMPPGELWVHCRSGYRAGIAASLLHRAGRHVVHVDDHWDRVGELHIETTAAAA